MNAPTPAAVLAKPTDEVLPLAAITPSTTHIQEMRRARYDQKALAELAASIKVVGILQPIVVRPLGLAGKYEIVAGERRYLAAKLAGLTNIRASVCVLSAEQVLEIQLIENLQREGLHELEEAEGYDELMKLKKINADAVGDMVSKSRSYVYGRIKLLALCPAARKAFYAGELDASTALEIARIPPHEFQVRAMKDLEEQRGDGQVTNFREAQQFLREHYTVRLKKAVFDILDAKLVPAAGSCAACPKNSANQADLASEMKGADVCTDPKCFDDKRQAHYAGARKVQEAKGKKVIYGDQAKKLLSYWEDGEDDLRHGAPYRKLNDTVYVGSTSRKVTDVVGKDYNTILIEHPLTGKFIEVATAAAIDKATKAKGGKGASTASGGGYNYGAASARAKAKGPDVDDMLNDRLAKLIHEKAPKEFGKAWLLVLAQEIREQLSLRNEDSVAKAWGWKESAFTGSRGYGRSLPTEASKLSERDLVLLMFEMVFACGPYTRDGVLKQFGIKEPATRDQIIEERKAAQRKAREDAKKAKEAKKAAKTPGAKGKLGTAWPFPTGARPVDKAKASIAKRAVKAKVKAKGKKK
jgi:ParB/RepB/Spo0J family partition protein